MDLTQLSIEQLYELKGRILQKLEAHNELLKEHHTNMIKVNQEFIRRDTLLKQARKEGNDSDGVIETN